MADAAASQPQVSDAGHDDAPQRRSPLLGRSPLRVIFRVAQVTLLLWAAVVLVERYNATSTQSVDASSQPADLVLGDEVFADAFDRGDGPLGGDWQVVTGNWVIADGSAQIVEDPAGALVPALAVTDVPAAERLVIQMTIDSPKDGVGVVYGYKGPGEFNRIGFNPTFAAVGVEQIRNGGAETIGRFGPVGIPATYEVSLEFARDELQLWVGNQVVGQVALDGAGAPRSFGLSSAAGSPAKFDDVRVYVGP
ncbi:MAG: hypothetical protein IPH29_01345 [Candidatus Microthrix sp.]|nr:hypothetical protein [Candidatus Microthrix sp.]